MSSAVIEQIEKLIKLMSGLQRSQSNLLQSQEVKKQLGYGYIQKVNKSEEEIKKMTGQVDNLEKQLNETRQKISVLTTTHQKDVQELRSQLLNANTHIETLQSKQANSEALIAKLIKDFDDQKLKLTDFQIELLEKKPIQPEQEEEEKQQEQEQEQEDQNQQSKLSEELIEINDENNNNSLAFQSINQNMNNDCLDKTFEAQPNQSSKQPITDQGMEQSLVKNGNQNPNIEDQQKEIFQNTSNDLKNQLYDQNSRSNNEPTNNNQFALNNNNNSPMQIIQATTTSKHINTGNSQTVIASETENDKQNLELINVQIDDMLDLQEMIVEASTFKDDPLLLKIKKEETYYKNNRNSLPFQSINQNNNNNNNNISFDNNEGNDSNRNLNDPIMINNNINPQLDLLSYSSNQVNEQLPTTQATEIKQTTQATEITEEIQQNQSIEIIQQNQSIEENDIDDEEEEEEEEEYSQSNESIDSGNEENKFNLHKINDYDIELQSPKQLQEQIDIHKKLINEMTPKYDIILQQSKNLGGQIRGKKQKDYYNTYKDLIAKKKDLIAKLNEFKSKKAREESSNQPIKKLKTEGKQTPLTSTDDNNQDSTYNNLTYEHTKQKDRNGITLKKSNNQLNKSQQKN